jgi:hypothetical protein
MILYRQDGPDFYDAVKGGLLATVTGYVTGDFDVPGAMAAREHFHATWKDRGVDDVFCVNDLTAEVQEFLEWILSVKYEEGPKLHAELVEAWGFNAPAFSLVVLEANAHLWKTGEVA